MRSGVSLVGGWDRGFARRDPATLVSRIVDRSASGGEPWVPNRAVTVPDGVATGTVLEGFLIQGGTGMANAAVVTLGSAAVEIRNNRIRGGPACTDDQADCSSIGIQIESPASVVGNHVEATIGSMTYAIEVLNASPLLASNVIVGSTSGAGFSSTGIVLVLDAGSTPRIVANTIDGGAGGSYSTGIHGFGGSPVIDDNVISTSGGKGGRVCINAGLSFQPQSIRSNDLFDCPQALYT
jgi:hypothetical protein